MKSKNKKNISPVTLPESGNSFMVQSAYAKLSNVEPSRISALVKKGVIILVEGLHNGRRHRLVDVSQADIAIAEFSHPAHNSKRNFKGSTTPTLAPPTTDVPETLSYKQATTKEKIAKAHLAELELQEKKGSLVKVSDVSAVWADQIATIKTRLRSLPTKSAQKIIHSVKNNKGKSERLLLAEVQKIMLEEIDETLEGLSNGS